MKKAFPLLWLAAVFLTIFSSKLWLIDLYGSALPWWDQWVAEGWQLYIPFFNKTLVLKDLFMAHCEHRIFVNRVMALLLLKLNGQWDAQLGMLFNAFLAAGIGAVLSAMSWNLSGKKNIAVICLFNALVFSLPFSWECSVLGFLGNYWLILFAIMAAWLLLRHDPPKAAWFAGLVFAGLSLVTMGSGFFAAAAVLAVFILRSFRRIAGRSGPLCTDDLHASFQPGPPQLAARPCLSKAKWPDFVSMALLLAIVIAGLFLKVNVPEHAVFRATNVRDLMFSFMQNMAWPNASLPWMTLIAWLPYLLLLLRYVFNRYNTSAAYEFPLAMGLWVAFQDFALAFSRSGVITSRHTIFLCLALPVNFLAMILLLQAYMSPSNFRHNHGSSLMRHSLIILFLVWTGFAGHGLWKITDREQRANAEKYKINISQCEKNVREFVQTDNIDALQNKPLYAVPFPDPNALAMALRNAKIRPILPECALPTNNPGPLSVFAAGIIPKGDKLLYVGIGLLLILAAVRFYQSLGALEKRLMSLSRREVNRFLMHVVIFVGMVCLGYALHALYSFLSPGGLNVTYFRGIDFGKKICSRSEKAVSRDYEEHSPAWRVPSKNFSALWQGSLIVPETAVYDFYAQSDDGMRLIIDGTKIIDNWRNQSWQSSGIGAQVRLEAGRHQIAVEHYNADGESALRIKWCGGPIQPNTVLSAPYLRKH